MSMLHIIEAVFLSLIFILDPVDASSRVGSKPFSGLLKNAILLQRLIVPKRILKNTGSCFLVETQL